MSSYEDFRGRLVCKSCGGLLEDAVQFLCGCRMCEKCAEDATRSANEGSFTCEACREVLTNGGDTLYFADTSIRREIAEQDFSAASENVLETFMNAGGNSNPEREFRKFRSAHPQNSHQVFQVQSSYFAARSSSAKNSVDGKRQLEAISKTREAGAGTKEAQASGKTKPVSSNPLLGKAPLSRLDSRRLERDKSGSGPSGHVVNHFYVKCAECLGMARNERLKDHRRQCWKLHLYNGKSFRLIQVLPVEQRCQYVVTPSHGHTIDLIPDGIEQIRSGIMRQFHDISGYVEGNMRKFLQRFQKDPGRDSSIDDPIVQTMRWKIENVSLRLREGQSLLSRSFCSSSNGYTLQLRLDFHNECFTVHVVLVRGDHDNELPWPFKPTGINLSVLGGATTPDICCIPVVHAVERCHSEMEGLSIWSMTLQGVQMYLIDDCLFIRCTVT